MINAVLPKMTDSVKALIWKIALSAVLFVFILYAEGNIGTNTGYASRSEVLEMEDTVEEIELDLARASHSILSLRIESVQARIFEIQAELCAIDLDDNDEQRLMLMLQEELADLMNNHRELAGFTYQLKVCG